MDDLDMLARDFGFKPQGKSAPMRSNASDRRSTDSLLFNDVFGGPPKYPPSNNNNKSSSMSDFDYDSIFKSTNNNSNANSGNASKTSSLPVYDKPVYDDEVDIFEGLPGLKSKSVSSGSAAMKFDDDVFVSLSSSSPNKKRENEGGHFDDLLENLGRNERVMDQQHTTTTTSATAKSSRSTSSRGFDDLLPGFGSNTPASRGRSYSESSQPPRPSDNSQRKSSPLDDPFVVLESNSTPDPSSPRVFTDPLEDISKIGKSGSLKADTPLAGEVGFDDLDPLNGFGRSVPPVSPDRHNRGKDGSPSRPGPSMGGTQTSFGREHIGKAPFRYSEAQSQKKAPVDSFQEAPLFDMPSNVTESQTFGKTASSPPYPSYNPNDTNSEADASPKSDEQVQPSEDVWLTVSEIPLFTQPTSAPPPSRPPPPIPRGTSKSEGGFFSSNARKKGDDFSSPPSYNQHSPSPKIVRPSRKSPAPPVSQIDELENFVRGGAGNSANDNTDIPSGEEMNVNSAAAASAAAMKEAMDRAEAKFRHAKELRERENAKAARSKEVQLEKEDQDAQDREYRDNQEKERERQQREKEEEEREQRRLERERERAREIEREKARQAVERATREARERAAAGARERASAEARQKAERAAVGKANAEARERAERAAVQRVQAEARERAAAEARERAERAAAEARVRASAEAAEKEARERAAVARAEAEARRRAERAAVERAAAEARERAAAEAKNRAEAAARMNQQKNDNDLESFFSMGSRSSSEPRQRANSSETTFEQQFQNKGGSDGAKRTSTAGTSSNMRKASSTTNIVDDLSSIFEGAPSGEFQDMPGETEERRRARLERHQRTQERAAKALAEKNQRDLQVQREQEERHRIAETLDFEIKRWAAGKEGNLRALLSTLQYVLWPECGWQPVSLTDLITGASVKKVYRKATLCIHPDKVQQKGATLQQKYIAEKVFDLLKEAWNKFNSEELF